MLNDYITREEHPTSLLHVPIIWSPKWILSMRFLFLAFLGAVLAILNSGQLINIANLNYTALWIITLLLFISNVAYVLYYRFASLSLNGDKNTIAKRLVAFIRVQINIDLLLLTLILHFSGGATNPFVFFYIFHATLSSILLSKRAAYFEAIIATGLFCTMTFLEGFNIITHYTLFNMHLYSSFTFMIIVLTAVISTLFFSVYMATSIVERMRLYRIGLEDTLKELRRVESEKSRFLDIVVHDLKSPIVAIESLVNSILSVHGDEFDPEIKKLLDRIPVRTKDLVRFIKKLLEFSHIRKQKQIEMQRKMLDILPIVNSTVEIYSAMIKEKNLTLNVQSDKNIPPIMGSREHLDSMVGNLVSNAIRYTLENGTVSISVGNENYDVILTVADTGIGIPEESLSKIFTDFYRASNAMKTSETGTGIGMSIIKSIVEDHGGTITVKSREGEGTTFTVRIPAVLDINELVSKKNS